MNRSGNGTTHAIRVAALLVVLAVPAVEPAAAGTSWTRWGGPDGNFTVESARLADEWPEEGPKRLWSRSFGEGYSGLLYEDGRLYTMYRDSDDELVVALDAESGETLWEHRYAAPPFESQTRQFGGGPNATPLIVADRLVTVGFTSRLHCLDKRSGEVLWAHDLVREFGAQKLQFGYSASPILHDGRILVLVGGGEQAALGFLPADGKVVWKSEPLEISYASPTIIDVDGQEQLAFMTPSEVAGIDLASGRVLWRHPHENQYRNNCAGPWWGEDNLLFVSSQGDAGSRTLKLTRREGKTLVEEVARDRKMKIFHNTAVRLGEWIYAGSHEFVAAHNVRTGKTAWKEEGFSEANVLVAGGKLILLDEEGRLALASASPEGLTVHSSVKLLEKPAWAVPTLVGSRLYVRGRDRLLALELGTPAAAEGAAP